MLCGRFADETIEVDWLLWCLRMSIYLRGRLDVIIPHYPRVLNEDVSGL